MFSGLLYCADCGEKLYYSVTNNYSREQAYFFCSNYRKATENCTAHYIREKVVYQLVLESMRRVLYYVQAYENDFVQRQLEKSTEEQKKELARKRRELSKAEKRIAELDVLFQRIYEDNISGKWTKLRKLKINWGCKYLMICYNDIREGNRHRVVELLSKV